MSVALPVQARADTQADLAFFLHAIQNAQISSTIVRELWTPQAQRQSIKQLVATVTRLDSELRRWYAEAHLEDEFTAIFESQSTSTRRKMVFAIYLRMNFYNLLMTIHSAIAQPWENSQAQRSSHPDHITQVEESSRVIAEASRSTLLVSQLCEINVASLVS